MTMGLEGTYDSSQVFITVGGLPLTGFSEGDSVTTERSTELYTYKVGINGSVGRSRSVDKTGTIVVKTLGTSFANDELSALFNIDSATEDGKAVLPITINDFSGRSVIFGSQCWLEKVGAVNFGSEVGEREWTFRVAVLTMFVGGNAI